MESGEGFKPENRAKTNTNTQTKGLEGSKQDALQDCPSQNRKSTAFEWPFFTDPNSRDAGRRPRYRTDSMESFQQGSWAIPETPAASISDMTASNADQDRGTQRHRRGAGVRGEEAYTAPFGKASRVYNIPLHVQCRQSSAFAKAPFHL